jgi:hypothetical protein
MRADEKIREHSGSHSTRRAVPLKRLACLE